VTRTGENSFQAKEGHSRLLLAASAAMPPLTQEVAAHPEAEQLPLLVASADSMTPLLAVLKPALEAD
jgi:hypothetical protein